MGTSLANFSQAGYSHRPSPSIWGDCPGYRLNEQGNGVYAFEDFLAEIAQTTTVDSLAVGSGVLAYKGNVDTEIASVADHLYGAIYMETDTTAGDAGALVSRVFGKIVKNSGNRLWFEARVAPGDVDDDMGTFIGLVEEDGADETVIDANPADNDATADVTLIGFYQNNGDPDAYDVLVKNDTDDAVVAVDDATNASALGDDGASLTDNTFWKLGIRFDGRETIHFYVNGVEVGKYVVDSTVDQTNELAAIVAVRTGDGAAELLKVDWVRYAYHELNYHGE